MNLSNIEKPQSENGKIACAPHTLGVLIGKMRSLDSASPVFPSHVNIFFFIKGTQSHRPKSIWYNRELYLFFSTTGWSPPHTNHLSALSDSFRIHT